MPFAAGLVSSPPSAELIRTGVRLILQLVENLFRTVAHWGPSSLRAITGHTPCVLFALSLSWNHRGQLGGFLVRGLIALNGRKTLSRNEWGRRLSFESRPPRWPTWEIPHRSCGHRTPRRLYSSTGAQAQEATFKGGQPTRMAAPVPPAPKQDQRRLVQQTPLSRLRWSP